MFLFSDLNIPDFSGPTPFFYFNSETSWTDVSLYINSEDYNKAVANIPFFKNSNASEGNSINVELSDSTSVENENDSLMYH